MLSWFSFFSLIYLIKEISDTSLSYSISLSVWILSTLHCESFSTTSLTVSKNSSMISFNNFTNKTWNTKSVIDIILIMFLIKNLIKIIDLPSSKSACVIHLVIAIIVGNLYLIIVVRKYFTCVMTSTFLVIKKWSNSYCYFNFTSTIVFVFYFSRA